MCGLCIGKVGFTCGEVSKCGSVPGFGAATNLDVPYKTTLANTAQKFLMIGVNSKILMINYKKIQKILDVIL